MHTDNFKIIFFVYLKIIIYAMSTGQIMREYITETEVINLSKFNIYMLDLKSSCNWLM